LVRVVSCELPSSYKQITLLHLLNRVEAEDVEAFGEDGGCGLAQKQAVVVHLKIGSEITLPHQLLHYNLL
jgi:hypothetical protein